MAKKTEVAPPTYVEPSPSVTFNFTKKLKMPANFTNLKLEEKITVLVIGTVASLRQSTDPDYTGEIRVEIDKIDIQQSGPKNLSEARSAAMKKAEG